MDVKIVITLVLIQILISLQISLGEYANQIVETDKVTQNERKFEIDYDNNSFLKDGEKFRFISGSFHYFRAHPDSWQKKLRTMRAAGLNAVTTYVEWSLHNPKENVYNWDGIADLERFIELSEKEDLLVILRPGPYICAERDMGGFPYWLLTKYPKIKLRTADTDYLFEVRKWYQEVMGKMKKYMYGNGGPIIMVQVENEYGSFQACDKKYREWLRDETELYVEKKAVLFTNDGPGVVKCGKIDGVLATLDFGATDRSNLESFYRQLRRYQPKGPIVNAEYYPGWLTHWQEPMARVDIGPVKQTFIDMLKDGASVNFYMFYGGTNFGFTAGANDGGPGRFNADVTSYDYDAPMDEAGNPTSKYYELRTIIGQYLPLPNISVPEPTPKQHYGTVRLTSCCSILSHSGRNQLSSGMVQSPRPESFENLDQYSGLVLYETYLPELRRDPSVLKIEDIHDRGYVYVNKKYAGVLSRENQINEIPILPESKALLQIVVENQGRINYNIPNDFKGILSNVLINTDVLHNWNMTKYPLDDYKKVEALIKKESFTFNHRFHLGLYNSILNNGPTLFYGDFEIQGKPADTFLDSTGWGKGIAFINGFNLGRYWPVVGPQITLYVPREILKTGSNKIVLIEYQNAPESGEITLSNIPNLDGF